MLIRLLRSYLLPYRNLLWAVVALQFVQTMATLLLPTLNADLIDNGIAKGDTGYIWKVGAIMLGVTLVQVLFAIGATYFGSKVAMRFGRDVRDGLFHQVTAFSTREVEPLRCTVADHPDHQRRHPGADARGDELHVAGRRADHHRRRRLPGDPRGRRAVDDPAGERPGAGRRASATSSSGWCPPSRQMQERIDRVNKVLREQITGIRVVRAFVREPDEVDRFDDANVDLTETSLARRTAAWPSCSRRVMLVLNLSSVAAIWFGGDRIASGDLQIGALDRVPQLPRADPHRR